MKPELSVVTCSSDRPEAFALCRRWMERQTFPRERFEWIIVTDGERPLDLSGGFEGQFPNAKIVCLDPAPSPRESFRRNMIAGLESVTAEKICCCEDDDFYHPYWLSIAFDMLDQAELVGAARARYYHVGHRMYRVHQNAKHASLSTTGFRRSLLPTALKILHSSNFTIPTNPEQLDGTLWKRSGIAASRKLLLPTSPQVVSIKGMPGKRGLGIHHQRHELAGYTPDPDLVKLREWIGADAECYARFAV